MPLSFQSLLRRTVPRLICYNLSKHDNERIFNTSLLCFEKICLSDWYSFLYHEIEVILTHTILPQMMEKFTPIERREKYLLFIERIVKHDEILFDLVYNLDVINSNRCIHGIVDCLIGILVETCTVLKHKPPMVKHIVDKNIRKPPNSYASNYRLHYHAIRCLANLCQSYAKWFQNQVVGKNMLHNDMGIHMNGSEMDKQWQKITNLQQVELEAMTIARDINENYPVRNAIKYLVNAGHQHLQGNGYAIAAWLHKYKFYIPESNIGIFLGGTRPAGECMWQEICRQYYFELCHLDFNKPIQIIIGDFLLNCFCKLPSESSKIERLLESFAIVYYKRRPDLFSHEDAAFILLNAILMLNTSIWNPRIKAKDKLKKSIFLSMCMRIPGINMSSRHFEEIYEYVQTTGYELHFKPEDNISSRYTYISQFDEWKSKYLLCGRMPLSEEKKQINEASKHNEENYKTFGLHLFHKSMYWLNECKILTSNMIVCRNNVELACLLMDNWWYQLLDALEIVLKLNDDSYSTPLILSTLAPYLQIALTLNIFGHKTSKLAFNSILNKYKTWWIHVLQRIPKTFSDNIPSEQELSLIESLASTNVQTYFEQLKKYISRSQHIIHLYTLWSRLRDLQFTFDDVYFMLRGREYIGEEAIIIIKDGNGVFRLLLFNDMILFVSGTYAKQKTYCVLLLIFCKLENVQGSECVFKICLPQKTLIVSTEPNKNKKKVLFQNIQKLISQQRMKVKHLIKQISEKENTNDMNYTKIAERFQNSSAFLHHSVETIEKNKEPLPDHCKLCLRSFGDFKRLKKQCPLCMDNVCRLCMQQKAMIPTLNKKKNVCDGCINVMQGSFKL
eukprot:473342_1